MKLTAFGTFEGNRSYIESFDYKTKKSFYKDMQSNGYKNIKVYNEEDIEHLDEILEMKFSSYKALQRWRKKNNI